jgi:hypothetical protein
MPIFTIEAPIDVDFEVFCSCGNGLCNQSETRSSRHRGTPQVVVEPCEKCLASARTDGATEGADSREGEIIALKDEIADLKRELAAGRDA